MNRFDWQKATDGLSKYAKILALKWGGMSVTYLTKNEVLSSLALTADEYTENFDSLVLELTNHGLEVEIDTASTPAQYRRVFAIPNEFGLERRAMVGAAFLEGETWRVGEAIKLYTGYEDHQKVVEVIGKDGLPRPERQDSGGTMGYRLPNTDPVGLPKKHAVPMGTKKTALFNRDQSTCQVCLDNFNHAKLSPDHRIPTSRQTSVSMTDPNWMSAYQSLCVPCNHEKREACKRCQNLDPSVCQMCFWHNPKDYDHLAGSKVRVDRITWQEDQLELRAKLHEVAQAKGMSLDKFLVHLAQTL